MRFLSSDMDPEIPMTSDEAQVEESLARRMRRGDRVALTVLTTRYWNAVHRIGLNMLGDPFRAGKLAEETFLTMMHSSAAFPPGVPFRTSLYRVAITGALARGHSSPANGDRLLATFLPKFDAAGDLAAEGIDWSERDETAFDSPRVELHIRETLQRLEPLDRATFLLREIEQLSEGEAADVLQISPPRVRDRVHRASLILTGALGELFRGMPAQGGDGPAARLH